MQYRGTPKGGASDLIFAGLAAAGVILWVLAGFKGMPAAVLQALAICAATVAIYILIRYRLTLFEVRLGLCEGADARTVGEAAPEELELSVFRIKGSKIMPLARLGLDELLRQETVPAGDVKERARGASLYRYNTDMSPKKGLLLIFDGGEGDGGEGDGGDGGDIALYLDSLPEEMMAVICRCIRENSMNKAPFGDE